MPAGAIGCGDLTRGVIGFESRPLATLNHQQGRTGWLARPTNGAVGA